MNFAELLFWYFAAFGVSYIVGFSKISFPFRVKLGNSKSILLHWFLDLIECPACVSTWLGFFYGALKSDGLPLHHRALTVLLYGASTSGVSFLLGRLTGLIESDKKFE